jgi:uncharacterized protein (DUF1684 family)
MQDDHAPSDAHAHQHHEHHAHEPLDYADAVRAYRAEKDAFFRDDRRSPVPAADRAAFDGLPYFEVDKDLVFEDLALEPYAGTEPTSFQIPTTDGRLRPAERAGVLRFSVGDVACGLTAYRFEGGDDGSLFVPFLDGTTGVESYGAGRYLDVEPEEDGSYVLDFNLAYHPSCVYDPRYSCPLTPAENRLPVRIEAGERLPEGHAA